MFALVDGIFQQDMNFIGNKSVVVGSIYAGHYASNVNVYTHQQLSSYKGFWRSAIIFLLNKTTH
jgi:hypothetical protein